jgi:hypothetical protein
MAKDVGKKFEVLGKAVKDYNKAVVDLSSSIKDSEEWFGQMRVWRHAPEFEESLVDELGFDEDFVIRLELEVYKKQDI